MFGTIIFRTAWRDSLRMSRCVRACVTGNQHGARKERPDELSLDEGETLVVVRPRLYCLCSSSVRAVSARIIAYGRWRCHGRLATSKGFGVNDSCCGLRPPQYERFRQSPTDCAICTEQQPGARTFVSQVDAKTNGMPCGILHQSLAVLHYTTHTNAIQKKHSLQK